MEKEYRRKEDFDQAYKNLGKEDKKELEEIREKLEKIGKENKDPNMIIEDRLLKSRIAKICSKLIEETPNDKTSIMETSYIITGSFIWSNYGDKLDEAIQIAGELELPEEHVSGDVLQRWEEMRNIFQKYLT